MGLVKVAVRMTNGLIVECELKTNNFVFVKKINGGRK